MDISCKKTNCIYNKSLHCSANAITVGSDLDCKTFLRNDKLLTKVTDQQSKTMFETATLEPYIENEAIAIDCKATKCLFNREGTCTANGISILSGRKSAFCTTSIKK